MEIASKRFYGNDITSRSGNGMVSSVTFFFLLKIYFWFLENTVPKPGSQLARKTEVLLTPTLIARGKDLDLIPITNNQVFEEKENCHLPAIDQIFSITIMKIGTSQYLKILSPSSNRLNILNNYHVEIRIS